MSAEFPITPTSCPQVVQNQFAISPSFSSFYVTMSDSSTSSPDLGNPSPPESSSGEAKAAKEPEDEPSELESSILQELLEIERAREAAVHKYAGEEEDNDREAAWLAERRKKLNESDAQLAEQKKQTMTRKELEIGKLDTRRQQKTSDLSALKRAPAKETDGDKKEKMEGKSEKRSRFRAAKGGRVGDPSRLLLHRLFPRFTSPASLVPPD
ncbi:hypothetical protein P7C70_g3302, partial [Phenoliferia sp. Uapishka_3]